MSDLNYILQRLEAIDTKFDEKLDKILVQTTKTNGRVNALEDKMTSVFKEVEDLKEHKNLNNQIANKVTSYLKSNEPLDALILACKDINIKAN